MSEKFRNKYRSESARLKNWDYGSNGAYFITICTKNREHFFGEIDPETQTMQLNQIGKLAEQFWLEIPVHFPFVELGEFVVMPNHTHGVLIIDKNETNGFGNDGKLGYSNTDRNVGDDIVGTRLIASLQYHPQHQTNSESTKKIGGITGDKNPMIHNNISRIIRWYKGRSTFEMRKINPHFAWQPRFHDHIIRNQFAFDRIQKYIANNPLNWKEDRFGK
ncbi:MAG: transposase [Bacteroidetes bacterium]|nr:transposase [Bacteroidota bacterium]MBL0137259.1 transposase [Bacteroidota bacterium]